MPNIIFQQMSVALAIPILDCSCISFVDSSVLTLIWAWGRFPPKARLIHLPALFRFGIQSSWHLRQTCPEYLYRFQVPREHITGLIHDFQPFKTARKSSFPSGVLGHAWRLSSKDQFEVKNHRLNIIKLTVMSDNVGRGCMTIHSNYVLNHRPLEFYGHETRISPAFVYDQRRAMRSWMLQGVPRELCKLSLEKYWIIRLYRCAVSAQWYSWICYKFIFKIICVVYWLPSRNLNRFLFYCYRRAILARKCRKLASYPDANLDMQLAQRKSSFTVSLKMWKCVKSGVKKYRERTRLLPSMSACVANIFWKKITWKNGKIRLNHEKKSVDNYV